MAEQMKAQFCATCNKPTGTFVAVSAHAGLGYCDSCSNLEEPEEQEATAQCAACGETENINASAWISLRGSATYRGRGVVLERNGDWRLNNADILDVDDLEFTCGNCGSSHIDYEDYTT